MFEGIYIYLAAAVLPAAVLMFYIYKKDTLEPEPPGLLAKLALRGVLAALASGVLETIAMIPLDRVLTNRSPLYLPILCFCIIAVIEEGTKYVGLRTYSWNRPDFNYCFDGIVYSVFVSLGFAAFENIGYVMGYGLSVAPTRALLAIPAHLAFSVFMGYFYGRARRWANLGERSKATFNGVLGLLSAVLLHGFYDYCAMSTAPIMTIIFFAFVIATDIIVIITVHNESKNDHPIWR